MAALVAVAMLALPGTTLAASQSSSTAQTLTVNSTVTLTGVPASVNYGSGLGGVTLSGPANSTSIVGQTNNPTGLDLTVSFSDLARTGGGGTIVATANRLTVSASTTSADCGASSPFASATTAAYAGPAGTAWTICSRSSAGSSTFAGSGKTWTYQLDVPAAAVPGTYTGTATWSAVEKP